MLTTMTTTNAEPVADRLLRCFPAGTYCLPALLRLTRIVESTAVPSVCVECVARPRLLVNPEFVAARAQTPEKLMMLVMHELHHVILGHTRLFPRATPLDNLAFDAVINAMLCRLFPEEEYTSLFTDLYRDDRFPECFLRPVPGWSPKVRKPRIPAALAAADRADLAALHAALYSEIGVTYEELRKALEQRPAPPEELVGRLLGDHRPEEAGASSCGGLERRSPTLLQEIRRIVERWPRPKDPVVGRSLHEILESGAVAVPRASNRTRLIGLLRRIGGDGRGSVHRTRREIDVEVLSACPAPDRRAVVIGAMGGRTLLYRRSAAACRTAAAGELVHVYLDVSGSIGDLVGPLYRAVLACRRFVEPTIHLFSTKVADVSLGELRRGVCKSTGGTDICCVAEDMRARGVLRAVLVTDGYVGEAGVKDRETLERIRLGVALTPGGSTRDDLDGLTDYWCVLHEVEREG